MVTRRRLVPREHLVGKGKLLNRSGSDLVRYDLQFSQEMLRADTLSGSTELGGHGSGRGTLEVIGDQTALLNIVEAVLELEDGQQIDVLFKQGISPHKRAHRFITSGDLRPA